jgi:hypothetical protein
MMKISLSLRVLSATLAMSLVSMDVVWALDPRQKLYDDQASFSALSDDKKEINPSEFNESFEASAMDAVSHQQMLADFENQLSSTEGGSALPIELEEALDVVPAHEGEAAISYDQEVKFQEIQTVLPVNVLKPAYRDSGWSIDTTNKTLSNNTGNRALDYKFTMLAKGDLEFDLEALAIGTRELPAGYTSFNIALYVDGVRMSTLNVGANKTSYQSGSAVISGIGKGVHTLRLLWENDMPNTAAVKATKTSPAKPATGTDIRIRNLTFTQITRQAHAPAEFLITSRPPQSTNQNQITVQYTLDKVAKEKTFDLAEGSNLIAIEDVDSLGRKVTAKFSVTRDTEGPALGILEEPKLLTKDPALTLKYSADGNYREKSVQLSEGKNTVYILEKDSLGNPSYRVWDVVLDTQAPSILPIGELPGLINQASITIEYRCDGKLKQRAFDLVEGQNMLIIEEVDAVGNRSIWQKSIELDTKNPVLEALSNIPTLTRDRSIQLLYRVDGSDREKMILLEEGINQIVLDEADAAGNRSSLAFEITLDTIAPRIVIPEVQVVTNQKNVSFDYMSDSVTRSYSTVLVEGQNRIAIKERDEAGNESEITLQIVLDTQGPIIEIMDAGTSLTNSPNHRIAYKSDGVSREMQVTLLEGLNPVTIQEVDAAGNVSEWTTMITLDTIPPNLILPLDLPSIVKDGSITISYMLDGESRARAFNLEIGDNIIRLEEVDAAGNRAMREFNIHRKALPVLVVSPEQPLSTTDETVQIRYTLDGQERFKTFDLSVGENVILLRDADELGQEAQTSITLTRTSNQTVPSAPLDFTLKTADQSLLTYKADQLAQIQTADGNILKNLRLDSSGKILDAEILLSDGSVQLLQNGEVLTYLTPDGTRVYYSDGRIQKTVKEAAETFYSYELDSDGKVLKTIMDSSASRSVYGADGKLEEILQKSTGQRSIYEHGILRQILNPDASQILFKSEVTGEGTKVSFDKYVDRFGNELKESGSMDSPDGSILSQISWNEAGQASGGMLQSLNGDAYTFANGIIDSISLPDGMSLKDIAWKQDGSMSEGILWDAVDNQYVYRSGVLEEVRLPDGSTMRAIDWDSFGGPNAYELTDLKGNIYQFKDKTLDRIVQKDGSYIENITWDALGRLKDYEVEDELGNRMHIQSGAVAKVLLPGGEELSNIIFDLIGGIKSATSTDSNGNRFSWANGVVISAVLYDGSILSDIVWSGQGHVKDAVLLDLIGNRFDYKNGELVSVFQKDHSTVSGITWNSSGRVQSALLLDSQNNEHNIRNGKTEQIRLAGGLLLKDLIWSGVYLSGALASDAAGNEYRLIDRQVSEVRLNDGSALSGISWDQDGKIQNATLSDASGNQWIFSSGKLNQIRPSNGSIVRVSVWAADGGVKDATVTDVHNNVYTITGGALVSVRLASPDFSTVTNIVWANDGRVRDAVLTDTSGNQYIFKDGVNSEIKLYNGLVLSSIVWNSLGRVQDAILTDLKGNKFTLVGGRTTVITFPNGSVLSAGTLDSAGNIVSGLLVTTAGVKVQYVNRQISTITLADGSKLSSISWNNSPLDNVKSAIVTNPAGDKHYYADDILSTLILANGTMYKFYDLTWDSVGNMKNANIVDPAGNQWFYVEGQLSQVKSMGTTIQNPVWNSDGTISGGVFTLSDGSKQAYENNQFLWAKNPNGTVKTIPTASQMTVFLSFTYKKLSIQIPAKPNLGLINYYSIPSMPSYPTMIQRNILRLEKPSYLFIKKDISIIKPAIPSISNYVASFTSKNISFKKSPVLLSKPNNADILNPRSAADSGIKKIEISVFKKELKAQRLNLDLLEEAVSFDWILYDDEGSVTEIQGKDGARLNFEDGVLEAVRNSSGEMTNFDFVRSGYMNLVSARIDQGGVMSEYDAKGSLTSVSVMDTVIRYKADSAVIDTVQKADGTKLENILLDESGAVQNALITTADGEKRTYENGHLTKIVRVDTSELGFEFDPDKAQSVLKDILTVDKLRYTFDYTPDKITAVLDSSSILPSSDTIVRMEYDASFRLLKAIKQNDQIIQYDPSVQVQYLLDGTAVATKEGSQSFYDVDGKLQKVILPPAGGSLPLEVRYANDKISEVYQLSQPKKLVYKYSYTTRADGSELVQIEDVAAGAVKSYSQGKLLTVRNLDTNVLETYSYMDGAEQVFRVDVTRLGRAMHSYIYRYEGSDTLVTDESGVVRTYNADKKLIFMDRNGERFAYTYSPVVGEAGVLEEEVVTEELVEKKLADQSIAHYINGALDRIELKDGSVITNISFDKSRNIQRATMTLANGVKKIFDHSRVAEEILPDGTHFYYESGQLSRATDASGLALAYTYDKDSSGKIEAIWVDKGDLRLKYSAAGDLQAIKLDSILEPEAVRLAALHGHIGGSNGEYSYDGLWNTAQTDGFGGSGGNVYRELYSTTMFAEPSTISSVTYRMFAHANSSGGNKVDNGSSANTRVEYLDASTGQWTLIPGTALGQSHNNGGGGGSTAYADTANPATVAVNISNVLGIRAYARAAGYANGGGNFGGSVAIYDLDYTLADQSILNIQSVTDASGAASGFIARGALGTMSFTLAGEAVSGYPAVYASAAGAFDGQMIRYIKTPHFDRSGASIASIPVAWTQALAEAALDSEQVTFQEYSSAGILETQTRADGTVTLFDDANRPSEVLDATGRIIMQYFYDGAGNPSRVYLKNARDVLPDEVAKAKQSIQEARAESLLELAKQKNLAYQTIYATSETQKNLLQNEILILSAQRDGISGVQAKGKAARAQRAAFLGEMDTLIADYRNNIASVAAQAADAYASLDTQVKNVSRQIEESATEAFAQLKLQEAAMKREIVKQEISPIIYSYYRRILGRDPASSEYEAWADQVNYDAESNDVLGPQKLLDGNLLTDSLNDYLYALPELAERTAYVQSIKNSVREKIASYLNMDALSRAAYGASLGLSVDDLIELSAQDAQKILTWLDSRSLHFGQSAFLSLESLLDQKGIHYAREDIALKSILVDILSGVISPLDEGDIVISVFALNTVAKGYGLDLTGAGLTYEALLSIYRDMPDARVIAHINSNHFVIITGIDGEKITYIDPGIGKDKENESVTVTRAGFEKAWSGNAIADSRLVSAAKSVDPNAVQILSAEQTKSIRGAFWGSILSLVGSVLSWIPIPGLQQIGWAMTIISTVVAAAEGDFLTAIGNLATLGFGGLQGFFGSIFDGLKTVLGPIGGVLAAVGGVIKDVYQGVVGVVNSAISYLPGIGGTIQGLATQAGMNLGAKIVNTALMSGVSYGTTRGLTALGASPEVAGFISSLATASLSGALSNGVTKDGRVALTQSQAVRVSMTEAVMLDQVGRLGLELGLDPNLTGIIGMSLGAIQGQQIGLGNSFEFTKAFEVIKPDLVSSLAGYGIQELGSNLGWNEDLTQFGGLTTSAFLSSWMRNDWTELPDLTAEPVISMDSQKYYDEKSSQEIRIPGPTEQGGGSWNHILKFLGNNFVSIAIATTGAYLLTRPAFAAGSEPAPGPGPIQAPIPQGAIATSFEDRYGQVKEAYKVSSGTNYYAIYDRNTGRLLERMRNGLKENGEFQPQAVLKADGTHAIRWTNLTEGAMGYVPASGGEVVLKVQNENVTEVRVEGPSPDVILKPGALMSGSRLIEGVVEFERLGLVVSILNGIIKKSSEDSSEQSDLTSSDITSRHLRTQIFANGFENEKRPINTPDPLMEAYIEALERDNQINPLYKLVVYLYELTMLEGNGIEWIANFSLANPQLAAFVNLVGMGGDTLTRLLSDPNSASQVALVAQPILNDLRQWYLDYSGFGIDIVQKTIDAMEDYIRENGPITDGIAFVHSGGTAPVLEAIERMQYDVDTVLIYEGPHYNYYKNFTNPNLKRIIHVMGTAGLWDADQSVLDALDDAPVPFLGQAHFGGTVKENINITILGARHSDFSFNADDWIRRGVDGLPRELTDKEYRQSQVNFWTNRFMRTLYERARSDAASPGRLHTFLLSPGITGNAEDGWIVDLEVFYGVTL